MVLKLWDVDNGKVIYLKHTNSKNESRLVKLKDPMEYDRIPISELDKAIELMFRYVSSIKKLDNFVVVNGGKDDKEEAKSEINVETKSDDNLETKPEGNIEPLVKVETKPEGNIEQLVKVETKPEGNIETKPEGNIEDKPYVNIEQLVKVETKPEGNIETKPGEIVETKSDGNVETKSDGFVETRRKDSLETKSAGNYDIENGKREIPQEVNEKLDLLLQKDEGRMDGPQYLINKNAGKDVNTCNNSLSTSNTKTDISSILRGNAATRNRTKERKKKGYSKK